MAKNKKTHITRSVRLESEVDAGIQEAAAKNGLSVNQLASRALKRYVEWDFLADRFGFVEVPPELLQKMVEYLADESIREVGKWFGGTVLKEYVLFWFKEINFKNVIKAFPEMIAKYGRMFEYEQIENDDGGMIIIKHQWGEKWSIFYDQTVKTAFGSLLSCKVKTETSPNQITMSYLFASIEVVR
ncbi:MAG: hypothetical protein J9259_09530 [Thermoplasmata archaeon YP2-bin.285]|uniref:Uncharacterized protein n=1 Tax=Candidatus Sysuiplasma superficiale TaxID=2823368 RepID=A0A8J7YPY7_9ARCH|nr:hypothetical protein [Candidatus Sysuiplasma superficiale]